MNSGSTYSEPIKKELQPMQNSNATIPNLSPKLRDSVMKEQLEIIQKQSEKIREQSQDLLDLASMIKDMQSQLDQIVPELESLKKQGRTSDIEKIRKLSSENSNLMKKLQKKSETIVSLNDRIGKLSGADLILKENERLEMINKELTKKEQNARNEATAKVSAIEKEYQQKQALLQSSIDAANAREHEAQKLIADESAKINALAESKVSSTKNDLKRKYDELVENQNNSHEHKMVELEKLYKGKVKLLYGLTRGGILYGVFVTMLTAVKSQRFSDDFILVFKFLGNYICFLLENAFDLASAAWSLKEHIPCPVIDILVSGLLAVLGFLVIYPGILVITGFVLYIIGKAYSDKFTDTMSVAVALVSLALLVWFADSLTFIKCNLILVFLIIHAVYVFLRMMYVMRVR